ncbi:DUF5683 domain-containing protein [Saccharicrinis aurantiacus]|uniref:DUF5683 domain-containing protein n=1 Tax=Saccharicrinis aurantiacus TaxID=1849719 RepID=UPI002492293B|nr:DUF5683 domain-containing protein [Saccharicrinis aurantiacus]
MINIKSSLWVIGLIAILNSFAINAKAQSDTAYFEATDTLVFVPEPEIKLHSPHKATLYSAILPGLGQAYNKKYWKIPLVYAALGGLVYAIDFNSTYYSKYKTAYRDYVIQDPNNTSYLDVLPRPYEKEDLINESGGQSELGVWFEGALENKKNYYKRYRDLSYVGIVLVYVLNLVDASVDAHFKTYDVSNDLSIHWEPIVTPIGSQFNHVGLQVRLVF